LYGLSLLYLLYLYALWLKHVTIDGGWATWWKDTTVERTYPGGVRYFSIDYWSMVCLFYLWLFLDPSHHNDWHLFATHATLVLFPAAPQILVAAQCTLSSNENSLWLGLVYIAAALIWTILWMPSQKSWLNGARPEGTSGNHYGPSYKGRMGLACHNPNCKFMTLSIMVVGAPYFFMFGAWLELVLIHESWWCVIPFIPMAFMAAYIVVRHIGLAVLLMMAAAKLSAGYGTLDRTVFDTYDICTWTFWGQ